MKILNREIMPGESVQINLDTVRLHTRTRIDVPVIIERAKEDGPVLLIIAGIHGDEVNGVEIVRKAVSSNMLRPDKGTVICIPVLNVFGFLNQRREFPDGKDLNRYFPGSEKGSLASQFAATFMKEIVPHSNYCIDFHTGGSNRFNIPQIRISKNDETLLQLANAFHPQFIVYANNRDKSFRESATKEGLKVLLFEGGKSLDFNNAVTDAGLNGIMRLMHAIGMRDYATSINQNNLKDPIIIEQSYWHRARHSGLFRSFINGGEYIMKGHTLGSISDPFGEFEYQIKAKTNGHIIGLNYSPIVTEGDALYHIGN
ncbi:succinylglutamate desuccinylase/aspartoacylase family protein [uncultured Draconibacterium sp.]|uniref:succinylglutamate desuccinylase/aspartoacylase family protein n=1 Tax=uncultured Draconibacterium sp. TaxID=1573823 RepID=UPI0029C87484|nr:succinylglutamate desuccinylase/aspartoacylase family protein [uncultured Draconibacterium sp.]